MHANGDMKISCALVHLFGTIDERVQPLQNLSSGRGYWDYSVSAPLGLRIGQRWRPVFRAVTLFHCQIAVPRFAVPARRTGNAIREAICGRVLL